MALPTSPYFGMAAGRYAMVPAYSPYAMYRVAAAPVYYSVVATQRSERDRFYEQLHAFRASIGQPIVRLPTLGFKELDLWTLYREVTRRNGIDAVIARKQWKEVAEALRLPSSCTDSGFRLRLHYKKYLEAFERKYFSPPNVPTSGNRTEPNARRKKRRAESPTIPRIPTNDVIGDVTPRSTSASTLCSVGMPSSSRDTPPPPRTIHHSLIMKKRATPPTSPAISSASGSSIGRKIKISVDFARLDEASVRRYARKHEIDANNGGTLADACSAHFSNSSIEMSEARVIGQFVASMNHRRKNKLGGRSCSSSGTSAANRRI